MLEFDQHRVTAAASGAHALQLCDKENFDVVILDFIMPEMRGDKLALALKERFPERPIIMITGDAEKMENVHRPPVGVDFLMGKPFRLDHLREALKTVLVKA
jgi:two-component system response regulator ResD